MMFNLPKSDDLQWTQHSLRKLRQYNLSVSRIKRVLRFPKRKEVGVAPDTIASMQPAGSAKHQYEIWVMYATKSQNTKPKSPAEGETRQRRQIPNKRNKKIYIISVWKYPGISPIHEPPPIPEEVWEILAKHK
jgi:hypothetical protein